MSDWISLTPYRDSPKAFPVVQVALVGPAGDFDVEAIIDTGSDVSVFPQDVLEKIGVNFSQANEVEAITGTGSGTYLLGSERIIECRWEDHVVLVAAYANPGKTDVICLGVHDFLAHFIATFKIKEAQFRLEPAEPGCCDEFLSS